MTPDETSSDPASEPAAGGAGEAGSAAEPGHRAERRERRHLPIWQESILLVAVALGLAIIIKAFFVQAFYIPSPSMEPGLIKNDRILVQKVSYWFGGSPDNGDVVVFKDPGGWLGPAESEVPSGLPNLLSKIGLYPTGGHLVKRVIGTEGDILECCDDQGRVSVNGQVLDEDYLGPDPGACNASLDGWAVKKGTSLKSSCSWTLGPVPAGKLFVMGDNRGHSGDSRVHICNPDDDPCTQSPWVDADLVVGKVFTLIWPASRWTWVGRPDAFESVPDSPPADLVEKTRKQAEKQAANRPGKG